MNRIFCIQFLKPQLAALLAAPLCLHAQADTPPGWIDASNSSAYTTTRGELEISGLGFTVNDSLDVMGYKAELIAASGRLTGDSGDLVGDKLELSYGITEDLSVYYRRQNQSLTLELSDPASVDLVDIDDSLNTLAESAGLKWTFFRGNLLNAENRQSAASIELSAYTSESEDFELTIDEIRLENLTVTFPRPQTFSIAQLNDEGWKYRILYTWPILPSSSGTVWVGYGESKASSGTTSDIGSATIKQFFEQSFELKEAYTYLGASLTTQITPRTLLNINYEYIHIADSKFMRTPETAFEGLPAFLSGGGASSVDENHILEIRLGYWLTPDLSMNVTGNLFANQFVGILPHYNNPLSGSFASAPYGFAGIGLNYRIRGFP